MNRMELILILPILIAFFVCFFVLGKWIGKAKKIGLVWEDMNKYSKPKAAGSGGLIVILAFLLAVLAYIAIKTFYLKQEENIVEIFALTTSILILGGIGIIDDLLGWHHGGLSKKFRLLLCIFAAIPLMVINVGNSQISFPFLGTINIGLLYPLILIPLGIVGAATTFNFLAGFNGLEAGQGVIILTGLSIVAYFTGNPWLSFVGICMILALAGFLFFNWCPARVFPGDVLTYSVGGLIAIMAILGNFERIALFFFIPYILEVILKLRGGLIRQSFGKPNKDNSLEKPYNKIYGLEHLSIAILNKWKGKAYEKEVVLLICAFQILIVLLGLVIFKSYIF
ncbi:MAG: glycosyl transferase family 4 [Candidatus Pacearchaeota archaeon]|nr:glycosyl transferase family 4 [Candidatus Pacearchaeota archaeon]